MTKVSTEGKRPQPDVTLAVVSKSSKVKKGLKKIRQSPKFVVE